MVLLIIIAAILVFLFGYFVGANNPLASVKAKIQAEAKAAITGASGALSKAGGKL